MGQLWAHIRATPLLWLLPAVPLLVLAQFALHAGGLALFLLSVLAIVPLAALLSHATDAVAERTGDAVGGLLNATLGNLTEMMIALTALLAGEYTLVKGSIAGAIVGNSLFMLGMSLLLGGLRHRTQEFNPATARLQAGQLFLATVALLVPSLMPTETAANHRFVEELSLALAVLLAITYALGLVFSLGTHKEFFGSSAHAAVHEEGHGAPWPLGLSIAVLAGVTLLVAFVSHVFVGSVQAASQALGMSDAFVGFVVVALVGAAAEMASAFSGARKNRLDLSVGIALGSATQIALFVAPVLVLASYFIGPASMNLQFWPSAVAMMFLAAVTVALVCNGGRSAWFLGVLVLAVYLTFATALYLLPPQGR